MGKVIIVQIDIGRKAMISSDDRANKTLLSENL
jgi:hypothetical protein